MQFYNEGNTYLCHYIDFTVDPEYICGCFDSPPGWTPPMDCYCDAPDDPPAEASMIHVSVVGEPIRTRPMDSTFTYESNVGSDIFNESNMVIEFSIHDTISREHDPTHVRYLKKYMDNMIFDNGKYKFTGLEDRHSYITAFRRIVSIYTKPGPPEPISENAHVGQRKPRKLEKKREKRALRKNK